MKYSKRDNRLKVVHKANEGVAVSRNAALETAKGEMIAFCDADDYHEKDMTRQPHDALMRNSTGLLRIKILRIIQNLTVKSLRQNYLKQNSLRRLRIMF